ncbi:hypothetical protein EAH89_03060 [Roseomonas nepalensis]|uniref:Uncharacterized protein n=1 Tax=Muricoccus nepalensis TaxID=1854500 RepID=A0A502GHE5_9PROT|nr:hypothetical protein [Roseomonas nepalensis]TPG60376.1 hypothetical protein EAH89_03060 [Roseomonas nepalensis]
MVEQDSVACQIRRELRRAGRDLASLAHVADYADFPQVADMLWSMAGLLDECRPGEAPRAEGTVTLREAQRA